MTATPPLLGLWFWLLFLVLTSWAAGKVRREIHTRTSGKILLFPGLALETSTRAIGALLSLKPFQHFSPFGEDRPVLTFGESKLRGLGEALFHILRLTLLGTVIALSLSAWATPFGAELPSFRMQLSAQPLASAVLDFLDWLRDDVLARVYRDLPFAALLYAGITALLCSCLANREATISALTILLLGATTYLANSIGNRFEMFSTESLERWVYSPGVWRPFSALIHLSLLTTLLAGCFEALLALASWASSQVRRS